ncbi:MAG: helix-turn-helix transcriptional regulator [Clostridia bacterium]|nr:helix-turn-helix transcriptional regulator [Clostridia bacterium]
MRLKQLREQKNISQQKLAIALTMNQNTISRYETGEREADYSTLIKIADYFDVSIDYLLERTDNPAINIHPHSGGISFSGIALILLAAHKCAVY